MRAISLLFYVLGVLAYVLTTWVFPNPLYAAAPPDDVKLLEAKAYTGLLETGDLLIAARYEVPYATSTPDKGINQVFVLWLENGSTRVATAAPYPYFDSDGDGDSDGYGMGVASIYMTAAQTNSAGLTNGSGAWTEWPDSNFSVYLEGNPSEFTTLPYDAVLLASGDFGSDTTQATNRSELGSKLLQWASLLQAEHATTLLVTGQNLLNDSAGAGYFALAVPGVRQMAPQIFAVRTESPTVPTPVPDIGAFASASEGRLDAVEYYGKGFADLAADLGVPNGSVQGAFVAFLAVVLIAFGTNQWGTRGASLMTVFCAVFLLPVMMIGTGWVAWAAGALAIGAIGLAAVLKSSREVTG